MNRESMSTHIPTMPTAPAGVNKPPYMPPGSTAGARMAKVERPDICTNSRVGAQVPDGWSCLQVTTGTSMEESSPFQPTGSPIDFPGVQFEIRTVILSPAQTLSSTNVPERVVRLDFMPRLVTVRIAGACVRTGALRMGLLREKTLEPARGGKELHAGVCVSG